MTTRRAQPVAPEGDAAPAPKATKTKAPRTPAEPKATKAPKEPKVQVEKAIELDADGNPVKRTRRVMGERNWLATEIDAILRASSGPVTVREIVASITNKEGEHPSSGAVAAALKRWAEQGYITITTKPLGFKAFPAKQKNSTLTAFLEKSRDARLTARRERRAAA